MPFTSHGRATSGEEGAVNKLFPVVLFMNNDVVIQFLKDMGLIRSDGFR